MAHDGGEPKSEGQATDEEYYRAASITGGAGQARPGIDGSGAERA
jgi:hypothetical protein